MSKRLFMMRVTVLAAALAIASVFAPAGTYDQINASGANVLKNPSFEQMDRTGKELEGWGVGKKHRPFYKIVADATASKHGAQYVTLSPGKNPFYLYGRVKGFPSGAHKVGGYIKGKGKMCILVIPGPKNWRAIKIEPEHHIRTKWFEIDSDQWRRVEAPVDIPKEISVQGQTEPVGHFFFEILTRGQVSVDQCWLVAESVTVEEPKTRAAAGAATADKDATAGAVPRPLVTIPTSDKAPVIDGEMDPAEWSRAAAVTGFTLFDSLDLSPRQTIAYVTRDASNLYFAFHGVHKGKLGMGEPGRDQPMNNSMDLIEIRLQPPGGELITFLGAPSGYIYDLKGKQGLAWNGDWRFKNEVRDSGETVGGIETFNKKIWTAEVAISFESLGVAPPKDGERWAMNFNRDYSVGKGEARRPNDWTSWAPIKGGFKNVDMYGEAVFDADAPAAQLLEIGDLGEGEITLKGKVPTAGAPVRASARVAPRADPAKTLSFQSADVARGAPDGGAFALDDSLKVAGATRARYEITVARADNQEALLRQVIPFTASAPLKARLVPLFFSDRLFVHLDAGRIPGLPERFEARATVLSGEAPTGVEGAADLTSRKPETDLTIDIAALKPGEYRVKSQIFADGAAEPLASSIDALTVPEPPAWANNQIGVSDKVPPPWTPVAVDGDRARITQREYRLGDVGLPRQVTALGEDLFAAPPRVRAVVGGKEIAWQAAPPKLIEQTDQAATWNIGAKAGDLRLDGTLRVEFDGFAFWDFSLSADKPVTVDACSLEFPFKKDRALYMRGDDATQSKAMFFAALFMNDPSKSLDFRHCVYSADGWVWPEQWLHGAWIGDDERGFAVMCETRENLKGKKRTEVERKGDVNTLKIHLIDGAHEIAEPLDYEYAWQATPVKPRPTDAKQWRAYYGLRPEAYDGFEKHGYITMDYWQLNKVSYPEHYKSKAFYLRKNRHWLDAGVKVVPYCGTGLVTTDAPELKPYLRAWEIVPQMFGTMPRGGYMHTCVNSSIRDYYVYFLKQVVEELDFSGLYLDVSRESGCANHTHGCGYLEDGEWKKTVNLWASRELYKRMWTYCKAEGRDAVLFYHNMPAVAFAGFVDVTTQGEYWGSEGTRQYDRLTPELFRTQEMKVQYGTPFTWYVFHHYYRGESYGGRVPLCTILAYSLPHRVLPLEGNPGIWPVWEATEEFWGTARFIPYWSPEAAATVDQEDVLASIYLLPEKKKALLVVGNWNREARAVNVRIDAKKLGLDAARLTATRAVDHPILQPRDPRDGDKMKNTPIVLTGGAIPLKIDGRNIEIIRLEKK